MRSGALLMSDGSANLMVPHAENRMAPLNAKTILIIDELRGGKRGDSAGTSGERGEQQRKRERSQQRTNDAAARNRLRIAFAKTKWMMGPSRFVLIRHAVFGSPLGS